MLSGSTSVGAVLATAQAANATLIVTPALLICNAGFPDVWRPNGATLTCDVPAAVPLALTMTMLTGYVDVLPPPCAGTLTVVGTEPVHVVPSYSQCVFTLKLAALS